MLDDERLAPVFALAAERRVPILIHGGRGLPPIADAPRTARRALPGGDADHRARRHRRPLRARRPLRRHDGRLLRHVGLEPGRPARLLPPRAAGADRLRVRLPVRPAAELAAHLAAHRARAPASSEEQIRELLAGNANRIADGEPPPRAVAAAGRRRARAADAARAHPPVPLDGDAAALDAPAGHASACSASRSTPATSGTATARSSTGSASCSSAARDLWRDAAGSRRRAPSAADRAHELPAASTSPTSWR